ncbi:hypothetical protein GCM10010389_15200 [Streptomyces echinoruber]|uniref:Chaplin domain-containing protein n=1 Tax=Streptomyces echinoruber TaxID=68898 RepID=A0A918V9J8_9ACTN|nr:hypothetical protein GCM10010389_15200 [Streptomyces echinoruber]
MCAAAAATSVLSLYGSPALADAQADDSARNSAGVAAGNDVRVPVDLRVNACGNTVDVVGLLNPSFGDSCANAPFGGHGSQDTPPAHGRRTPPPRDGRTVPAPRGEQPDPRPAFLADTGSGALLGASGGNAFLGASGTGAALVAAGTVLYRRARAAARR